MNLRVMSTVLAVLLLGPVIAWSQAPSNIRVVKIADHIYELTETYPFETNLTVSVGPDGILLVDAGSKYTMNELKSVLDTLGGPVKIIITTHAHPEHSGGNKAFGKEVLKIGHVNLGPRLHTGAYVLEEFPDEALPTITFADSMSVYFNGEQIRLVAIPGAHDDADIIVHFTGSKVVCTGALSAAMHFPTVDGRGGNALRYPAAVQTLIDLMPADVTLIPGHGRNTTMAEEKQFHDMLVQTIAVVTTGLASGKDVAALQQEKVLNEWASFEGGAGTANGWIQSIANAVHKITPKELAVVPLYYAFKNGGVDAAVAKWYELKRDSAEVYALGEGPLVIIGYYLLEKSKTKDAIAIFDLYIKEFPEAWNAYDSMGEAQLKDGNLELARTYYKKSIELNPQNTNGIEALKKL